MLRAHYAIMAIIPCIFAGFVACSGADQDDGSATIAEAENAAVRGAPSIYGTFRDELSSGGIALLTLKVNGSFHMEEAVVCVRYPCELPEIDGRFNYETRGKATILVLKDNSGATLKNLEILLKGDVAGDILYVREAGTSSVWQALTRSDRPWCATERDCQLQSLPVGQCRGAWTCPAEVCAYQCGALGSEPTFEQSCLSDDCGLNPELGPAQ